MFSRIRERITDAGAFREVELYTVFADGRTGARRRKAKPSSDVQEKLNARNRERRLARLINENFTDEDLRFDLTYAPEHLPQSDQDARREVTNYIRRLKRAYKRLGRELKYVVVTEKSSRGRYHHHMILTGGLGIQALQKLWGKGYTQAKPLLADHTGYTGLARYLLKSPLFAKSWTASRNLREPRVHTRDQQLAKKTVEQLAVQGADAAAFYPARYAGYAFHDIDVYYNEVNRSYYLYVRMYRTG